MTHQLRLRDIITLGSMTFAPFVSAGSVTFSPMIGLQAGEHVWIAAFGFLTTVVGLPVSMVVALARAGDGVDSFSTPIDKVADVLLTTACYLVVGSPPTAPRTATVSFEVDAAPLTGDSALPLSTYNPVYFAIVTLVSLYPGRLLDTVGSFLAPLKIIVLAILSVTAIIWPAGSTSMTTEAHQNATFSDGFINGYLTMNMLDATVSGTAITNAARPRGVTEARLLIRYIVWAGLMTDAGLVLLYLVLFHLGSDSTLLVGQSISNAAILHAYAQYIPGGDGNFLLAALISAACLVATVSLTCAYAEFFVRYVSFSYRALVSILGDFLMVVSDLGSSRLTQISVSVPIAVYPPCITLVVLSFIRSWWYNSSRVIIPPMFISLSSGILDGIKASAFNDTLPSWAQRLSLAEQGLVWLMPAVVMVVLTIIQDRAAGRQVTSSAH